MPKHDETTIFSTLLVDLAANEKGKVWPFSTYSVTADMKGGFSKTFDISPEELRMNFYLNKDNVQVHMESMKKLNERVIENRNYLRNSANKSAIYQEYCRNESDNPSALVDLSFLHQKGAVFGSSSNSNQGSIFGSSNQSSNATSNASNAFGSSNSNPFGGSSSTASSSTPAQSNVNPFQSSMSNPFGGGGVSQPAATTSNSASSAGTANPFGAGSGTAAQSNVSSQSNVFGSKIAVDESKLSKSQPDKVVYKKMEDLSAKEIEAYKSAAFTMETLPISAPAKEFCF